MITYGLLIKRSLTEDLFVLNKSCLVTFFPSGNVGSIIVNRNATRMDFEKQRVSQTLFLSSSTKMLALLSVFSVKYVPIESYHVHKIGLVLLDD